MFSKHSSDDIRSRLLGKKEVVESNENLVSDQDVKAVVKFLRERAKDFNDYAANLERGRCSTEQEEMIYAFEQYQDWFGRWAKFLRDEG